MTNEFVGKILRATGALRAGDARGATDIIQAALAAGGLAQAAPDPGAPDTATRPPRKPLSKVLATLAEGRGRMAPARAPRPGPAPTLPEGAELRDLTHSCAAGSRRYLLYVPSGTPRGLVVMLHGCTQTPEDFAAGTAMNAQAEAHGLLIAYPAQTGGDNSMSCWNWFRPGDQRRGSGEPALLADLTESLRARFDIDRGQVFVAGLSAGGAMAAILAEGYPDLYAAAGIHSGLAPGSASDVVSALGAMKGQGARPPRPARAATDRPPRVILFHGSADTTVHPSNAQAILDGLGAPFARAERTVHPATDGRRGYTRTVAGSPPQVEAWIIDGAPHAWAGGDPGGSYTDPRGPDASAEMVRFFLAGR